MFESLVGLEVVGTEETEMTLAAAARCLRAVCVMQVAPACVHQPVERVTRRADLGPQP